VIDESTAREQFNRLSEYDGFHALKREAVQDMLYAIEVADTAAIARLVIDEIKAESTELPLSAHIRRRMYEENERNTPDPVLEEHERWKAEAGTGVWKKGAHPQLDRHIELLNVRVKQGERMPPALATELRGLTNRLRRAG